MTLEAHSSTIECRVTRYMQGLCGDSPPHEARLCGCLRCRESNLRTSLAVCRTFASYTPDPSHHLSLLTSVCTAFREPLQFIVMSVMSGTFPDTYGIFYMTVNPWHVRGSSYHRHVYRHQENHIDKHLSRYHDGDDAHDGPLQRFSRR